MLMGGFLIFFILFFSVHNLFKVRLRPLCWPPFAEGMQAPG